MLRQFAVTHPRRHISGESVNVTGDIHDRLWIHEVVLIGKMLHTDIPTAIVTIVDELLRNHFDVLAGNAGDATVQGALTV